MEKTLGQKWMEIFLISTRLGLTSFGGPIAHLGYFHEEYVRRKKWLDEQSYADLVALCQFLPGPASSQVGIGIGIIRGGPVGGFISFLGFTLPSVIALVIFALLLEGLDVSDAGWLQGLKIVAVAVVAHAVWGMAQKLTPDLQRRTIALLAMSGTLLWQTSLAQVLVILAAGGTGWLLYRSAQEADYTAVIETVSRKTGVFCLTLFFVLLAVLPLARDWTGSTFIAMFDSFYRAGALVFGGGHVVLPLLEREFVPTGWMSEETFLAGYGAAQAVPGPLFTFASYLGTVLSGWQGALIASAGIFLPAFLLIIGALPFWSLLRKNTHIKGALTGVNAAVVGILLAAFYNPIWTSSITTSLDFILAAFLFTMLAFWKLPPWVIVLSGAAAGAVLL
ncbi:ChrA protein [Marinococcus halophilus]|uniref:Chromate transporter n=1 Tax=Marinococcus halophilus TaxID=1371 RepID=A0A510Y6I6_MARHA|nr:chromate transporter [Marinococcus halophilus]OZT80618.1 ChrA protein [Marinococcus halophilus]GEK58976.1 chromate transporter [Marinococcus halophilus]